MSRMMEERWAGYIGKIEAYLEKLPFGDGSLKESMRYSLLNGGKRLRPVLVLATAETIWGLPENEKRPRHTLEEILPAAAALELIHTYSLIHDDLPAMDDDDFRRGKPANHVQYGEARAILAGDGLLTYAFELLAQPLPLPPRQQIRLIGEVAQAAGVNGMVGGQVADLEGEGKKLTLAQIETIHWLKTGALITAAIRAGALLGGATSEQFRALTRYGQAIGLAFQIKDDILDVEGESQVLGKPAGSDLQQQKATYPAVLGLNGAKAHLKQKIREAQAELKVFGAKADFLFQMAFYVENRQN